MIAVHARPIRSGRGLETVVLMILAGRPHKEMESLDTGRRAVVEGSGWRPMRVPARFRSGREPGPLFAAQTGRARPVTGFTVVSTILGLRSRPRRAAAGRGRALTVARRSAPIEASSSACPRRYLCDLCGWPSA
jgi:hypothetical protein